MTRSDGPPTPTTSSSSAPGYPGSARPTASPSSNPAPATSSSSAASASAAPGTCSATRGALRLVDLALSWSWEPWRARVAWPTATSSATTWRTARKHGIFRTSASGSPRRSADWDSSTDYLDRARRGTAHRRPTAAASCSSGPATTQLRRGLHPGVPGHLRLRGTVVHPQHWPEDLDYTGKEGGGDRLRRDGGVDGSGPWRARPPKVTMLQRSPGYLFSMQRQRPADRARSGRCCQRLVVLGYPVHRADVRGDHLGGPPRTAPGAVRWSGRRTPACPTGYRSTSTSSRCHNPWDERMCLVADGDVFEEITKGRARWSPTTSTTSTETGVR